MYALRAYNACMKSRQYTIRGVSDRLDRLVREQTEQYGKSMNALLLEALARGFGASEEPAMSHDLDELAGTWVEDSEFDRAIAAFDVVDEDLWK